jgi:hypothetical protein
MIDNVFFHDDQTNMQAAAKNLYMLTFSNRIRRDVLDFFNRYQTRFNVNAISYVENIDKTVLYFDSSSLDYEGFHYVFDQRYLGNFDMHIAATSEKCDACSHAKH